MNYEDEGERMLNKQSGNMYGWVTHTWNPIKGKCSHACEYCYMKRFRVGELRKDFGDNLGEGNVIFVGSSTDMFAEDVPKQWIKEVLSYCKDLFPNNTYLFQTKNPRRFFEFIGQYPHNRILGTTIETNHNIAITEAPQPMERATYMEHLSADIMISIEPIMEFDLETMVDWIKRIKPVFVSIGADSQNNDLPEPTSEKVKMLIDELQKFTEVKVKSNLRRLMSENRQIRKTRKEEGER